MESGLKGQRERILRMLRGAPPKGVTLKKIVSRLGLGKGDRAMVRATLASMIRDGWLARLGDRYKVRGGEGTLVRGVFKGVNGVFGLVEPEDGGPAVYVHRRDAGPAIDGDQVTVEVLRVTRRGPRGRIVSVDERERPTFFATVIRGTGAAVWLEPDDPHMGDELPVLREQAHDLRAGDSVLARPVVRRGRTVGEVMEILGKAGEPEVEETKLLITLGHTREFPEEVLAEVRAFPDEIPAAERADRVDLTGLGLVTIDPKDARDFDDAVHAARLPDGGYELTVAIADVSHYVRPGTALDTEARRRATSVYLPIGVVPMLPERLSADLCSLRPRVERLAMVSRIRFDRDAEPRSSEVFPAVIRSRARLTYDQVAAVLDGRREEAGEAKEHEAGLRVLEELARKLHERRVRAGALDMDVPEPRAVVDPETRRVIDITPRSRNWAHRLVEEAMLAANQAVGAHLKELGVPVIWRIHERPDPEAIERFKKVATALGVTDLDFSSATRVPGNLARSLLSKDRGPLGDILAITLLSSMKQARYSAADLGHYGLATDGYLHFTSPIRRYPDLMVHRIVRGDRYAHEEVVAAADHCSRRERMAVDAERSAMDLHSALLLQDHLGETTEGLVVGITRSGLFIQLEDPRAHGFLPLAKLGGDRFVAAAEGHEVRGKHTGRTIRLGDRLRVVVWSVSPTRRRIDLRLAGRGWRRGARRERD